MFKTLPINNKNEAIIIFDSQGALGCLFKKILKPLVLNIFKYKKINALLGFLESNNKYHIISILLIADNEDNILDYLHVIEYKIPIVFAPKSKFMYQEVIKTQQFYTIDLNQSKKIIKLNLEYLIDDYRKKSHT